MNQFQQNKTSYSSKHFNAKGQEYCVIIAKGEYNYINVQKVSNNPFRGPGKDFKSFDDAVSHYKCPEIKTALLLIELNIKTL